MIIEVCFGLVGGINFSLEKSWGMVKDIMIKYPHAVWKKVVDKRNGNGRYIIEID